VLRTRLWTAIVALPATIAIVLFAPASVFTAFIAILSAWGLYEIVAMTQASANETLLVAIAGGTRAPALAADYGVDAEPTVEALLSRTDISAVIITSPQSAHCEQTVAAARYRSECGTSGIRCSRKGECRGHQNIAPPASRVAYSEQRTASLTSVASSSCGKYHIDNAAMPVTQVR